MTFAWGVWFEPTQAVRRLVALAQQAERQGATVCFVADEGTDRDLYVTLTAILAATDALVVAPAITNPFSRHPVTTAAAIATLAEFAPGRVWNGLGVGGSRVLEPLGLAPAKPFTALREAFDTTGALLRGEAVGPARLPWTTGPVPVAVAGRGPRVQELATTRADWVILSAKPMGAVVDEGRTIASRRRSTSGRRRCCSGRWRSAPPPSVAPPPPTRCWSTMTWAKQPLCQLNIGSALSCVLPVIDYDSDLSFCLADHVLVLCLKWRCSSTSSSLRVANSVCLRSSRTASLRCNCATHRQQQRQRLVMINGTSRRVAATMSTRATSVRTLLRSVNSMASSMRCALLSNEGKQRDLVRLFFF